MLEFRSISIPFGNETLSGLNFSIYRTTSKLQNFLASHLFSFIFFAFFLGVPFPTVSFWRLVVAIVIVIVIVVDVMFAWIFIIALKREEKKSSQ